MLQRSVSGCPDPAKLAVVWGRIDPEGRRGAMQVMAEVASELERLAPGMGAAKDSAARAANVARCRPLIELILLRKIGKATSFKESPEVLAALAKAGVKKDKPAALAAMAERAQELEEAFAGRLAES